MRNHTLKQESPQLLSRPQLPVFRHQYGSSRIGPELGAARFYLEEAGRSWNRGCGEESDCREEGGEDWVKRIGGGDGIGGDGGGNCKDRVGRVGYGGGGGSDGADGGDGGSGLGVAWRLPITAKHRTY
ncbi:hypothetical protein BHE74_00057461 [Ensete ventricosum]|nr:hypothetical protein BHE74_00057461 [Ensete ventricosum]